MRKRFFLFVAVVAAFVMAAAAPKAKYVFFFIGDGMGVNQVNGTETYLGALKGRIGIEPLCFPSFPNSAFVNTQSATNGVTDSAAGGTALATGNKTKNGALGVLKDLTTRVKSIAEEAGENIQEKVQALVEEYNAIGHVPFKEKDKIYEEYHAVLDKLYKELNISVAKRRLNNFKQNLKQVAERGENALDNERARLFRQYEAIKQEVQTYENNLGFLNASSKKGNSLIDEMNRKVQKLKDDMNLVREKIKAIDAENK